MDAVLQARAEQLAKEFANQHHTAEELNGLIRLMMKTALERMLNTELDVPITPLLLARVALESSGRLHRRLQIATRARDSARPRAEAPS